jgi:hypothetical protein
MFSKLGALTKNKDHFSSRPWENMHSDQLIDIVDTRSPNLYIHYGPTHIDVYPRTTKLSGPSWISDYTRFYYGTLRYSKFHQNYKTLFSTNMGIIELKNKQLCNLLEIIFHSIAISKVVRPLKKLSKILTMTQLHDVIFHASPLITTNVYLRYVTLLEGMGLSKLSKITKESTISTISQIIMAKYYINSSANVSNFWQTHKTLIINYDNFPLVTNPIGLCVIDLCTTLRHIRVSDLLVPQKSYLEVGGIFWNSKYKVRRSLGLDNRENYENIGVWDVNIV